MSEEALLSDARERFDRSLGHLRDTLRAIRTGRASSALVDGIRVDYYGTPTPINQLAQVSIPEPRQIIIKPFDPSAMGEISKAILKSDLGTAPQDDGKVLRISLPALSGEQRTKYVSKVKEFCEEARIAMRNGRREMNKQADAMTKGGELTEDQNRDMHEGIQDLLKEYEGKIDEAQKKKTTEITEV